MPATDFDWRDVPGWDGEFRAISKNLASMLLMLFSDTRISVVTGSTVSATEPEGVWVGTAVLDATTRASRAGEELNKASGHATPGPRATSIPLGNVRIEVSGKPGAQRLSITSDLPLDNITASLTPFPVEVDLPDRLEDKLEGTYRTGRDVLVWPDGAAEPVMEPSNWTYLIRPKPGLERVRIWFNAFIPAEISHVTKTVPGTGEHSGKSMIPGPPGGDCFLTDQRTFSSDRNAKARMHSEIVLDIIKGRLIDPKHYCDTTTEIDCEDGDQEGTGIGSARRMKFKELSRKDDTFRFKYEGAASNPLVSVSRVFGDIDMEFDIEVKVTNRRRQATVKVIGKVDAFPAFEGYAEGDGNPALNLFTMDPSPGTDAMNLPGGANRGIRGEVVVYH